MNAGANDNTQETTKWPPLLRSEVLETLHSPVSDHGGPFYRWSVTFTTLSE